MDEKGIADRFRWIRQGLAAAEEEQAKRRPGEPWSGRAYDMLTRAAQTLQVLILAPFDDAPAPRNKQNG